MNMSLKSLKTLQNELDAIYNKDERIRKVEGPVEEIEMSKRRNGKRSRGRGKAEAAQSRRNDEDGCRRAKRQNAAEARRAEEDRAGAEAGVLRKIPKDGEDRKEEVFWKKKERQKR